VRDPHNVHQSRRTTSGASTEGFAGINERIADFYRRFPQRSLKRGEFASPNCSKAQFSGRRNDGLDGFHGHPETSGIRCLSVILRPIRRFRGPSSAGRSTSSSPHPSLMISTSPHDRSASIMSAGSAPIQSFRTATAKLCPATEPARSVQAVESPGSSTFDDNAGNGSLQCGDGVV
jgi:hypothetical protein